MPVTGLAEAAFMEAARHGRFAIVTAGAHWALRGHAPPPQRTTPGFDGPWDHLSPELTALGQRPAGI